MSPKLARMALRQASLTEVLPLLAYVEGFAITVAGSGVKFVVREVVSEVIRDVLDGSRAWQPGSRTFAAHLVAVAQAVMGDELRAIAEARARATSVASIDEVRMSTAQVGTLAGVAELAHWAGESMEFIRMGDISVLQETVRICDDLRRRLQRIIDMDSPLAPLLAPPLPHGCVHPQAFPILPVPEGRGSASAPVAVVDELPAAPPAPRMTADDGDATPRGRR